MSVRLQKALILLALRVQHTIHGNLFVLLLDTWRLGSWILPSLPHLVDINMFWSWQVCFLTGMKASLADKPLPLLWLKSGWSRPFPPREPLLKSTVTRELTLPAKSLQQVCAIWLVVQRVHRAYHPRSSGLVQRTDGITKTRRVKSADPLAESTAASPAESWVHPL